MVSRHCLTTQIIQSGLWACRAHEAPGLADRALPPFQGTYSARTRSHGGGLELFKVRSGSQFKEQGLDLSGLAALLAMSRGYLDHRSLRWWELHARMAVRFKEYARPETFAFLFQPRKNFFVANYSKPTPQLDGEEKKKIKVYNFERWITRLVRR